MFRSVKKVQMTASTVLAASVLALTACAPQGSDLSSDGTINLTSIASDSSLSPEQKAEKMALAAEQLVTPETFMYAYDVAQKALDIDPQNVRARVWKAAIAPTMELQGIYARIEPLVKTDSELYENYVRDMGVMKKQIPEKAVADFLFDAPADIHTESEAQEVIARVTLRIDEFREVMNEVKNEDLTIHLNNSVSKESALSRAAESCIPQRVSEWVYDTSHCDFSRAYQVRLNRVEFESLQHYAAGLQTYLTIANSRDLSGLFTQAKSLKYLSSEEQVDALFENSKFGTLRADHRMGALPSLAKDAVIGVRYAVKMQKEFCPKDGRAGYVLSQGLCVENSRDLERTLAAIETALQGTQSILVGERNGTPVYTVVNSTAFFTQPLEDLRSVLPSEYDSCGNVSAIADGTLGGVFPTGDLNHLIADTSEELCPRYSSNR